jgi:hypothetical protein
MVADVLESVYHPSYYALRVCPRADAPRWWASARDAAHLAPAAIRAILSGRTRVELGAQEARDALSWARSLDGWDEDRLTPLWLTRTAHRTARPHAYLTCVEA